MSGKAAGSPRTGGTRATENAASVSLRGPRGNVEERGAFPWGAHQRDQANGKRLWAQDTGPGDDGGIYRRPGRALSKSLLAARVDLRPAAG
jgi:hypothetical protein